MQGSGTFWKLRFYIYTQYEGLGLHFKHTHTHTQLETGEKVCTEISIISWGSCVGHMIP